ncbi:hypothetical protein AB0K51_33025 [Kitasatospora sp. NPDC049285]|uniref:hypothetical protein n=1 Tax=Kitasatospora sp. NPDC049285 TaxID=3157096 RepID=UPI0034391BFA
MLTTPRPDEPRTAASGVRLVRAAAFAGTSATLGSVGHVAACGGVGWAAIGAGWLFLFSGAALAAGRRRGPVVILGATVVGQLVFHLLFQLAATPPAPQVGSGPASVVTGRHLGHVAGGAGLSAGMLPAHLAAAVAVGAVLHRVEVALWRLLGSARRVRTHARRWVRRFAALLAALVEHPVRWPVAAAPLVRRDGCALGALAIWDTVVRRGPPFAGAEFVQP